MFAVERHGDALVVIPRCDLVLLTRDNFVDALNAVGTSTSGRVVVSLLYCDDVDIAALGAIANASKKLGKRLALVIDPAARIANVFPVLAFRDILAIYPTVGDALAAQTQERLRGSP